MSIMSILGFGFWILDLRIEELTPLINLLKTLNRLSGLFYHSSILL